MKLIKLSIFTEKENFLEYIDFINKVRSSYKWSKKIYKKDNIENIYLISNSNEVFGYIECEYDELDINNKKKVKLFIENLHIAEPMQNKGAGKSIIERLLSKGVILEMVVAKENDNMIKLVKKFNYIEKYVNENTITFTVIMECSL